MAKAGDYYTVTLKKSHLEWGTHRYSDSRGEILGEGYIPIPKSVAYAFELLNSNGTGGYDEMGKNLFHYRTSDGFLTGILRSQGCNTAGNIYAKQFAGDSNLKALGSWFAHIGAQEGTVIKIEWISSSDIIITPISGTVSLIEQPNSKETIVVKEKKPIIHISSGDYVKHKKWGSGKVKNIKNGRITISFDGNEKRFQFPEAFDKGFLRKE